MNYSLTNNKKIKTLSLDDPDLPDWEECQNEIFNLLQNITDPEVRDMMANKISTLKFLHEMQFIEEVDEVVNNYFNNSQYEMMTLGSQESDNSDIPMEDENEKSYLMADSVNNFNLPDIMESIRTRFGYDENSMVYNDTSHNYHMFNEFTLNSMDLPSDSDNKCRGHSPDEYSPINRKPVKKVKFVDVEESSNDFQYSNENEHKGSGELFLHNSPTVTGKKDNFKEPFQSNMLFATQVQFANGGDTSYNDNDNNLKSPKDDVDYCTLFQTQAAFVTNFNKNNRDDTEDINIFATQMPIDNTKFITASQFPVPNKNSASFKIPLLPGIGTIRKKPIIPKETFATKTSLTVFESAIERTNKGTDFIRKEIKRAEEDDCNFFESDHTSSGKKSSPMDCYEMKENIEVISEEIMKQNKNDNLDIQENDIFISRSALLEVEKNGFCYDIGDVDISNQLIGEEIPMRYAKSCLVISKSKIPQTDRLYIKENEEAFPLTFCESQHIDRIPCQTERLSVTVTEMASLNINERKDHFYDFCNLIKKVKSTVKIIKTFKEQNYFDLNKFDGFGLTPLHYAVLTNKVSIVKWLIEECNHYINPHGGYDAKTPLHLAVTYKRISIIKELCTKIGIDVEAKDVFGCTPIDYCLDDEKIKNLLFNSKRKSFIKNNYFKFIPKILVDTSINFESLKKWKQMPSRELYEVFSLSKITTHWITKSLALDMIKESDALYEAIIRRIYILHENTLKIILENKSMDKFNVEENRYIYFKGILLENGKYEISNLKEGPKTKLAMKPNLFRGCFFYIDKIGVEDKLREKLKKWIVLGEGELLKDKLSVEGVLENRRDVVPFYINMNNGNSYDDKLSPSHPINTFIITDMEPEDWMEIMRKKNVLIKTSEFIKRCIRSFNIDYNY
uniref:ANK_REP_REGION domain-containing protein n=1 Tax=Strongyloides venezuelensis TaxID=75913 RepID=A0A0K0FZY9_STRVS